MTQAGRKFETYNGLRYSIPFPRTFKGAVTGFRLTGPDADASDKSDSGRFFHVHQGSLCSFHSEQEKVAHFWTELRDGSVAFEYAAMRISWDPPDFDEKHQQSVSSGLEPRYCGQTFAAKKRTGFSFATRTRPEFGTWLDVITQCTHWALEQVYRPLYTIRESSFLKEQIGCLAAYPAERRSLLLIRKHANVTRKEKARITNDVITTGQIEHNHILRKVDCLQDREQVITVHEAVRDSLKDVLKVHVNLPENYVRRICFEIIQALIHLHTRRNTLHGDLTVDNIRFASRIDTAKPTAVKVSGFHYACEFPKLKPDHEFNAASKYCWPPEMGKKVCTAKADIWMLGTLVFEALTGERAERFYEVGGAGAGRENKYPDFTKFFAEDTWNGLSGTCKDFLEKTLTFKPADRPDALLLESHPWVFESLLEFKPKRHSVITRMARPIDKSKPTKQTFPNRVRNAFGRSKR